MEKEWIGIQEPTNMEASHLVRLAIGKVDEDSHNFCEFVEMLHDICGMDVIATDLLNSYHTNALT